MTTHPQPVPRGSKAALTPTPPPTESVSLQTVRRLAGRQLRRHQRHGPDSPSLTLSGVCGEKLEPLRHANADPAQAILGYVLAPRFHAVTAVASSVMSTGAGRYDDALLAVAVTRAGDECCLLGSGDQITETFEPQGWLIDACRRSLGLATRAEHAHPLELPLTLWLDRLMVELMAKPTTMTWAGAVDLCPVPPRWKSQRPEYLGATMASITPSWSRLRSAAIAGTPLPVPVAIEHVAWMDNAMFTRWCLGFFPNLDDTRSDLEFLAPPEISARVEHALRAAYSAFAQ